MSQQSAKLKKSKHFWNPYIFESFDLYLTKYLNYQIFPNIRETLFTSMPGEMVNLQKVSAPKK